MKYPNGFYQMDSRIFDRGLKPIAFTVYNYLVSCAGSRRYCFLVVASSISLAPLHAAGLAHSAAPPHQIEASASIWKGRFGGIIRWLPLAAAIDIPPNKDAVQLLGERGAECGEAVGGAGTHPKRVQLPGKPLRRPPADQQYLRHTALAGLLRKRRTEICPARGTAPVRPLPALCGILRQGQECDGSRNSAEARRSGFGGKRRSSGVSNLRPFWAEGRDAEPAPTSKQEKALPLFRRPGGHICPQCGQNGDSPLTLFRRREIGIDADSRKSRKTRAFPDAIHEKGPIHANGKQ